jgi:hypothetical protein
MRAALAFLNGAGSRRRRQSGSTDRGLLALTDLLLNPAIPGKRAPVPADLDPRPAGRAPNRR